MLQNHTPHHLGRAQCRGGAKPVPGGFHEQGSRVCAAMWKAAVSPAHVKTEKQDPRTVAGSHIYCQHNPRREAEGATEQQSRVWGHLGMGKEEHAGPLQRAHSPEVPASAFPGHCLGYTKFSVPITCYLESLDGRRGEVLLLLSLRKLS